LLCDAQEPAIPAQHWPSMRGTPCSGTAWWGTAHPSEPRRCATCGPGDTGFLLHAAQETHAALIAPDPELVAEREEVASALAGEEADTLGEPVPEDEH